jgi:ribulose-5-phosphate 4-epimerase/fuculose-1-phosphate aldolase
MGDDAAVGKAVTAKTAAIAPEEWKLRVQLAACYQLFDHMGWAEGIFNHISLRVPGPEHHYLLNPFGLNYNEVTASNLIKVDVTGRLVETGPYGGNPAGFALHGIIHERRPDAHCVIHTHSTPVLAVACKADGLRFDNFYSAMLDGRVGYHAFEGITVRMDEGPRMAASLGDKDFLVLRNHGVAVLGRDLPSAFQNYWTLQRACEVQLAASSMTGDDVILTPEVRRQSAHDAANFDPSGRLAQAVFDAAVRHMEAARAGRYVDFRS